MGTLRFELRRMILVQRAIIRALQIVEGTASDFLQVLVDREAQEEEATSQVDEVVDAGFGVDNGEDFDFDGNNDERPDHYQINC